MIKIKIKNNIKSPSKLSVFDFDGTLFKSPDKPNGYKGNWWIEKKSLSAETVGDIPKDSMWNLGVVRDALEEISNKNAYCAMMTGRIGNVFEERIKQLLSEKKLNFDQFNFNSFGKDTGAYKINEIKKILKKYPSIKNIEMWEDEEDKIDLYTKEFSNKYHFYINRI